MASLPEQVTKPTGNWSQLLAGKVVIVTGAGGAIGSAIAYACALHGARIAVADVNQEGMQSTQAKILQHDEGKKDSVMVLNLDVSDEQSIQQGIQSVVDRWKTIDILVNKSV